MTARKREIEVGSEGVALAALHALVESKL